jgi:hypothetical protein
MHFMPIIIDGDMSGCLWMYSHWRMDEQLIVDVISWMSRHLWMLSHWRLDGQQLVEVV